jgi:hypothetical protein
MENMSDENTYKLLDEITYYEWALWEWLEATSLPNEKPLYMRGKERTPDRAVQEAENYRLWLNQRKAYQAYERHN